MLLCISSYWLNTNKTTNIEISRFVGKELKNEEPH